MTRRAATSSVKWINLCISTEKEDVEDAMATRFVSSVSSIYQKMSLAPIYEAYSHKIEIRVKSEQTSPFRRWASNSGGGALGHRSYRRPGSLVACSDHDMFSKCVGEAETDGGAAASTVGKVSNWSLGLRQLLTDAAGYATFAKFLANEYSKENIEFWQECERYRTASSAALAQEIWAKYLREGAPQGVNVDAKVRLATQTRLQDAPPDLFEKAQEQIFRLMEFDSYVRFLRSDLHAECARAELLGQPSPYLPTPSKLKKSCSNAEDARSRSVLARLRGARATQNNNNNNKQSSAPRRPSLSLAQLCRVMLPDSATSMQNTRSDTGENLIIRESIDNLLKNRGIKCKDYDVIIRGDPKPVNIEDSMSTLAGREVVVERRVVLRLQVAGCRPLSARTAPDKQLAAVVRSALGYHQYPINGREISVTRAGEIVPLDTRVEHLENERLQIHIAPAPAPKPICKPEGPSTNEQSPPNASANRLPLPTVRPSPANQIRAACPSLDEITNRVFEDVLHGKAQLQAPTGSSVKSDNCSSEHSSNARGAIVTKLRPGDPLHTAPTTTGVNSTDYLQNHHRQRITKPELSNCGLPRLDTIVTPPVPAARNLNRPLPAVRTSLAKQISPNHTTTFNIPPDSEPTTPTTPMQTSPHSRTSSESESPRTADPPPLPPKPKVLPTKPPNWGQNIRTVEEETPLNRMVYLSDQPTSSFV